MVLDEAMERFFACAVGGLREENNLLSDAFRTSRERRGLYTTWATGVAICWEPHLAYLVLRSCLRADFPFEIGWEEPYPKASRVRGAADLVVKTVPLSVVEMKHCGCDPRRNCRCPSQVRDDAGKVRSWPDARRYLFLTWTDLAARDEKVNRMIAGCALHRARGTQSEYVESTIPEPYWGVSGRVPLFLGMALLEAVDLRGPV